MPTLPLRLRNVLHQPVDGVVGVGRLVHRRRILRPVQRPVHHVVALRAVLAANILRPPGCSRPPQSRRWRCRSRTASAPGASWPRCCVSSSALVRRARQQDRRMLARPSAPGSPCAASPRRASGSSPRAARNPSPWSPAQNAAAFRSGNRDTAAVALRTSRQRKRQTALHAARAIADRLQFIGINLFGKPGMQSIVPDRCGLLSRSYPCSLGAFVPWSLHSRKKAAHPPTRNGPPSLHSGQVLRKPKNSGQ